MIYDAFANSISTSVTTPVDARQVLNQTPRLVTSLIAIMATGFWRRIDAVSANDASGLAIELRRESLNEDGNSLWLVSRTVDDADGRAIYSTGSYPDYDDNQRVVETENNFGLRCQTLYDENGRVIESRTEVVDASSTQRSKIGWSAARSTTPTAKCLPAPIDSLSPGERPWAMIPSAVRSPFKSPRRSTTTVRETKSTATTYKLADRLKEREIKRSFLGQLLPIPRRAGQVRQALLLLVGLVSC